eukprot:1733749-Rhodomonas_salina.1
MVTHDQVEFQDKMLDKDTRRGDEVTRLAHQVTLRLLRPEMYRRSRCFGSNCTGGHVMRVTLRPRLERLRVCLYLQRLPLFLAHALPRCRNPPLPFSQALSLSPSLSTPCITENSNQRTATTTSVLVQNLLKRCSIPSDSGRFRSCICSCKSWSGVDRRQLQSSRLR